MSPTPDAGIAWLLVAGLAILAASWWCRWRARWTGRLRLSGSYGTVYVMQDTDQPHLLKVGVTVRLSRARQAEIARTMTASAPLRQLHALDIANARSVETVAHRRLHRLRDHGGRGREWYRVTGAAERRHLLVELERAAHDIRCLAPHQGAWRQQDDAEARRWSLTSAGPARTSLFQTDRTMQHPLRAQLP